ncbi:hypothetical protein Smlt0060 [Stenotrophomonas maltophilia K279a]|uniref:Uncharacterized protein n=2 Tax=Stenotrophomonas TaxID=40323 RepID=B2FU23_STRMK|nr:hypothetical protein Smlt0060 [Stenotrophomonas maltophilia K279a]
MQHCPVAAQSATGFSSPNPKAHQRPSTDARRFFVARCVVAGDCLPVLRRAVRGGRKACRLLGSGLLTAYRPSPRLAARWRIPTYPRNPAMSHDTLAAPSRFATRIAHHLGEIADTLDWDHSRWLALTARLEATGKAPEALTLGEVQHAIAATVQEAAR